MTKTLCPARCGKKFITAEHAEAHADKEHLGWKDPQPVKQRGWTTPYGFVDFSKPVTYDEALQMAEKLHSSRVQ